MCAGPFSTHLLGLDNVNILQRIEDVLAAGHEVSYITHYTFPHYFLFVVVVVDDDSTIAA
jgi:hypothetical protein